MAEDKHCLLMPRPCAPTNLSNKQLRRYLLLAAGVVAVEAPAGTTPAVLIVEKMGYQGKGALDYIANITISSSK